jgi:hypothetical protein
MCISVSWDNADQTVLRATYDACWTWRDHAIALDVINTMLDTIAHQSDLILDLQASPTAPQPMRVERARAPHALHPNWSGTLIVLTGDSDLAHQILAATPGFQEHASDDVPAVAPVTEQVM